MTPTIADLTVIVVTYNSAHCIAALAPTLAALPHVTIVDNASNDGTADVAARAMPNALVLRNERNLGFGAANNLALRRVTTSHALLLNPDCLPSDEFLRGLLAAAGAFPEAAIIAPHLIRRGGEVELSYRWPGKLWRSQGPAAEGPCCVGFVCGAAMLFNMAVMREIGFFDEGFFLYYEDEDLCQRVFDSRKAIVLVPGISVTHLSRSSVRGNSPLRAEFYRGYHHAQSKLIFTGKHVGAEQAARLRRKTLWLALAALVPRLLVPAPRYVARLLGRIRGLRDFK
ncbi:glycosyltransferase family 2 protein [Janthinobacterium sp. 17J80-10]|uniref:glycosyltransferase family 2 protein n=1 Tax=Janthinobacterium sp. 17J80-10 TaxID=2497863 RepID=UPI0010056E16|nr:glycosyltransferase family 2 protein [Janthinobacterium sp. 17J80-10]QAU35524.1 glycosyltransferase family 2 protein [Janthinobacterium sp. 17J80-10]